MAKELVIVGNSGFARECAVIVKALISAGEDIHLRGFLSFEGYPGELKEWEPYFLGIDDNYIFKANEYAIIGLGDPKLRQKCFAKLSKRNILCYTLIHPDVYVDQSVTMGEANIITSGCYISCNCCLGTGNVLNGVVHVGHDVVMGDFNFIGPGVQMGGYVKIGDLNSIGSVAVLLPHASIGKGNKIAPLSAVYKGCKDYSYLLGNPAIRMGYVWDKKI